MTDESIMPFGKYKGEQLQDVPETYLIWLYENGVCFGELKRYIEENMSDMKKIIERDKKSRP